MSDDLAYGYIKVAPEILVSLLKESPQYSRREIRVVSDPIPEAAMISHMAQSRMGDSIFIYLDGVEPREYRPLVEECHPYRDEIKDESMRRLAKTAMEDLLHAMGLDITTSIVPPEYATDAMNRKLSLFTELGEMLLGDKCPRQMKG